MTNLGLYIHIPFCSKKCDYCDFTSFCMGKTEQNAYLNALFTEIDLVKNQFKNKTFNTIFIGGGTPSVVFDGFILSLSKKIFSSFNIAKNYEFTIEVNPSSFNEKKFKEYLQAKINRISLGVQSINGAVTSGVNRAQTRAQIDAAFNILNIAGFKNISADVMLGLPNQSINSVKNTLTYLINNNVKHISTYTLQLEEGTPLYKKVNSKQISLPQDDFVVKQYNEAYKILTKHGFNRYEISNYALPNYTCQHNLKYWNNVEYLGIGIAAHSYVDGTRFWNTKNFNTYITQLSNHKRPIKAKEKLTKQQKITERIMLSLRTQNGLNLTDFCKEFNMDLLKTKQKQINNLQKAGSIDIKNGYLFILPKYFEISNTIILELV